MPYPNIDPVWFSIGPLPVRWYALAYLAGIVLGAWYVARLLRTPRLWAAEGAPPIGKGALDDFTTWVVLGVIAGGRLGFLVFYRPELFVAPVADWPEVFGVPIWPPLAVWTGGMSFHGGLISVAVATVLFARRRGAAPLGIGDLLACAAPIGLFFGRMANFINAELAGRPTDAPWGVKFPEYYDDELDRWVYAGGRTQAEALASDAVPALHPSQLYEAALEGLVLFIVIRIAITRFGVLRRPGVATGLFLLGYGLSRFLVEFFREPDTYAATLGFLTRGMMLSLPMAVLGGMLIWRARRRTATEAIPA